MNLREFLENTESFIDYYIGASEGGSFFFIGKPEQALKDIYDIQHKAYANVKKSRHRARLEVAKLLAETPKPSEMEAYEKLLKKKKDSLKVLNARVKGWTALLDREVLEVAPRITGGVKVIVDGFCTGDYWSINEYDKTAKSEFSKMDMHPDGFENLRGAILETAADDYKKCLKHIREKGSEPKERELTSNSLKAFFKSDWFDSLCGIDGYDVIEMIEEQVKKEEKEKVSNG